MWQRLLQQLHLVLIQTPSCASAPVLPALGLQGGGINSRSVVWAPKPACTRSIWPQHLEELMKRMARHLTFLLLVHLLRQCSTWACLSYLLQSSRRCSQASSRPCCHFYTCKMFTERFDGFQTHRTGATVAVARLVSIRSRDYCCNELYA